MSQRWGFSYKKNSPTVPHDRVGRIEGPGPTPGSGSKTSGDKRGTLEEDTFGKCGINKALTRDRDLIFRPLPSRQGALQIKTVGLRPVIFIYHHYHY